MSIILIDAGNSCLKIAVLEVHNNDPLTYNILTYESLNEQLSAYLNGCTPSEVLVSNVNNNTIFYTIADIVYHLWHIQAHLVIVEQDKFGVYTRYENPRSLGCDRWLTLIAAHDEFTKTVCIIDCGTAITIDVMTDKGIHLGGLISPGITLVRQSLGQKANNLPRLENYDKNDNNTCSFLATNTQDAILGGTLYQMSAFIERIVTEFKQEFGNNTECIITGGDAELILNITEHPLCHRETLVLDGLRIIAKEMFGR